MSRLTHTRPQTLRVRLPLWFRLGVLALIAGAAIALFLAVSADEEAVEVPNAAVSDTAAGVRYDGGPEEGTTGILRPGPAQGIRYDGGPEEGGHGIRHAGPSSPPPAGTRYDGGPEEGTRGALRSSSGSSATPGIRYDGGPEEGSALAP
jgi:hypothetical protein